jgi:hypothetical protein
VARDLADSRSEPIRWLRQHANYLSPSGRGAMGTNVAAFFRNLTTIYVVLALFFLGAFGLLNALAYWYPEGGAAGAVAEIVAEVTPLTTALGAPGPWVVFAELFLWFAVVPLATAYWLVSQDLPETFLAPVIADDLLDRWHRGSRGVLVPVGAVLPREAPVAAAPRAAPARAAAARRTHGRRAARVIVRPIRPSPFPFGGTPRPVRGSFPRPRT